MDSFQQWKINCVLVSMIESSVAQIETREEENYWRQLTFGICSHYRGCEYSLLAFVVICLVIINEWPPLSHRLLWFW